jgi:hypothetical protein
MRSRTIRAFLHDRAFVPDRAVRGAPFVIATPFRLE